MLLNYCPEATKPRRTLDDTPGSGSGLGPHSAWGLYGNDIYLEGLGGSYGMNWWMYNPNRDFDGRHNLKKSWKRFDVSRGNDIPLFFDCFLYGAYPEAMDSPADTQTDAAILSEEGMGWVCIDRHYGYLNLAFIDGSNRKVALEDLYTLLWNREFQSEWQGRISYRYPTWPDWMKK